MLLQGNRCQPSALRLPPALVVRLGEDRIQRAGHRPLCQPTFHGGQTAAHYSCKEVWMYRWVDLKRKPDPRYTSVCWWIDHLCSGFFPQETWTLWCWPNVTPVCQAPVWTRASATVTPWRPTGAAVLQASRSELWLIFLFCYFFNFYVFISMIYVWKSKKKIIFSQGKNCETALNACVSNPCSNGGTCQLNEDEEGEYRWERQLFNVTLVKWWGREERREQQQTVHHTCLFHSCTCPLGFEGPTCQTNIDDCEDNDCENGATCLDGVNNYTCLCPPYYTGQWSWPHSLMLMANRRVICFSGMKICF